MRCDNVGSVLFVVLLFTAGCLSRPMVRPVPLQRANEDLVFKSGLPIITSRAPSSEVVLEPVVGPSGRYEVAFSPNWPGSVSFVVGIRNLTDKRIEISEQSISASADKLPVHVFTAAEVEDSVHKDEATLQAFNFVVGALSASSYRGAGARLAVAQQTVANSMAISAVAAAQSASVASFLQRTTLDPGESVTGIVRVQSPRWTACHDAKNAPAPLCRWSIGVRVGEDVHVFEFDETP